MSGVYIRGMEIPTLCGDCKMYVEDVYCCHLLDREIENPWADDGVELDCPLVAVPPHGRLIDADALEELALNDPSCITVFDAVKKLHGMPTIIPAEEAPT